VCECVKNFPTKLIERRRIGRKRKSYRRKMFVWEFDEKWINVINIYVP